MKLWDEKFCRKAHFLLAFPYSASWRTALSMYSVYALYNSVAGKIYIGQTKDLEERMGMHDEKIFSNSYTSRYKGNWIVIYSEQLKTRQEALARENQLKSFRGREFVKQYIPR